MRAEALVICLELIYDIYIIYGPRSMRTLVDLPDTQIQALAVLCEKTGQPRAAIIREAVAEYLARHRPEPAVAAFGLWGGAGIDGLIWQEKVRSEW